MQSVRKSIKRFFKFLYKTNSMEYRELKEVCNPFDFKNNIALF